MCKGLIKTSLNRKTFTYFLKVHLNVAIHIHKKQILQGYFPFDDDLRYLCQKEEKD